MRNSNTAKSLRGRARVLRSQPVNFNQRWAKVTVPLITAQLHALEAVESPTATRSMSRSTDCTAATSPAQYVYYSTTNNARQGVRKWKKGRGVRVRSIGRLKLQATVVAKCGGRNAAMHYRNQVKRTVPCSRCPLMRSNRRAAITPGARLIGCPASYPSVSVSALSEITNT